ncbi:MAG: hypothetical protein RR144_02305 [Clostridia bacterium]
MKKSKIIILAIIILIVSIVSITIYLILTKSIENESSALMFQNENAEIVFSDITDNTISVKIVLTGNIKNIEFESNLIIQQLPEIKENNLEYYLTLIKKKDSHGIAALKVSGNNIQDLEKCIEY